MITTASFDPKEHLDAAAGLLAQRHKRDRARLPFLPSAFEDAAACRPQIESAFENPGWYGVVALDGSEVVGFAVMTTQLIPATHFLASFFPPRGVSLGYAAHAAKEGLEYDAYRAMYADLADHYVTLGYFDHTVSLPATDLEAREAWASLGFGRNMTCAIRDNAPTKRAPASGVEMHQAAYIRESDDASHDFQRNLLNDPAANAHWVGYEDGRAVAMNTFMQPFFLNPMTVPEKTIYLFQGIVTQDARAGGVGTAILSKGVEWAREQGYDHVALHFASANLPGAKFWQSSGFRPVEHGLRRHIDERIAWANK
jgi:GNAT superfamily N-acetyltransferase